MSMKKVLNIYWSRRDFRTRDNPALLSAVNSARKGEAYFLPIFILENYMCEANPKYQFGFPSRLFLAKTLPSFSNNFLKYPC